MDIDNFMKRGIGNLDLVTEKRNAAVRIYPSLFSQAKDIIRGSIRFRKR